MKVKIPRILIGGTNSGCGKTTVTSAVLQALVNRKLKVSAFKCGPDYIDPMFHSKIIGAPCTNLDLFLCEKSMVNTLLCKNAQNSEIAVMEGVMGYYDGVGGTEIQASACDLANVTQTPSVVVVSVKGMSLSVAAQIKGYLEFAPNTIKGIILNGVSAMMYDFYRDIIEKNLDIKVYGHLPEMPECAIKSRHLGLITADEIQDLSQKMNKLAQMAEKTIDIDGLINLANTAIDIEYQQLNIQKACDKNVRIAVAKDNAFCFYYSDSLQILRDLGAEIIEFSPLKDNALPDDIDGLYLGGGYPEIFAKQLSANKSMRSSVKSAVENGLPTIAECGGFLYLHEKIADENNDYYEMANVINTTASMQKRLQNFGYIKITAEKDGILCKKGEAINAHEFHYYASDDSGNCFLAKKPLRKKEWKCIHITDNLHAGYPHMHFGANIKFAENFVKNCDKYRKVRNHDTE